MEIDLIQLLKNKLTINEYLTLVKIDKNNNRVDFPFTSTIEIVKKLLDMGYAQADEAGCISLTPIGYKIVYPEDEQVDFDELFNLYPYKTPNGRLLRTRNKEISGKLTKEYKFLKDKYLLRVSDKETHQKVIEATKVMLNDRKNTNSLDYLQQLEVYLNRQGWERYMQEDGEIINIKSRQENIDRL